MALLYVYPSVFSRCVSISCNMQRSVLQYDDGLYKKETWEKAENNGVYRRTVLSAGGRKSKGARTCALRRNMRMYEKPRRKKRLRIYKLYKKSGNGAAQSELEEDVFMNILYCGDKNTEDGLIISILSLLKNVKETLSICVMTMSLKTSERNISPISDEMIRLLDEYIKAKNADNSIRLTDMSKMFKEELPTANMDTRFTPCCMLRLFSDMVPDMPERILYLDSDVVCRRAFDEFYNQDMTDCELAGVLDYYGKWFFRSNLFRLDYINSGVLLLNLEKIKETGLFAKCRKRCAEKKMFMPDQSAINKLAVSKKICGRKYNEQRKLRQDTVLQHFTTSFRFFPWLHTLTVKPWQTDKVHEQLKIFEYDDILNEYIELRKYMNKEKTI